MDRAMEEQEKDESEKRHAETNGVLSREIAFLEGATALYRANQEHVLKIDRLDKKIVDLEKLNETFRNRETVLQERETVLQENVGNIDTLNQKIDALESLNKELRKEVVHWTHG